MGENCYDITPKRSCCYTLQIKKITSKKVKQSVYSYVQSYSIYDGKDGFMSFNILSVTPKGNIKANNINYYAKDKALLVNVNDSNIETFAQKIYSLTK